MVALTGQATPDPPAPALALELRPERAPVALGEPLFLELTLRNGTGERVRVDLGHNRRSNLAFTIHLPGGRTEHPPRASEEGMGLLGREELAPGETLRERLLLNEWLTPDVAGDYQIALRLAEPAAMDDGRQVAVATSAPLTVRVLERDPDRLLESYRALSEVVLYGRDAQAGGEAARALALVADPIAVPFLAAVARNAGRGAQEALAGLGRIGTPEAVAALLHAAADRESGLRPHALRALRDVPPQGIDPVLRARIDAAVNEGRD